MNDEIKEILEFKENADYKRLSCDEIAILRDYIDNLSRNEWGNEVKATNQKIKIKELEKRIVKLKDNITNLQHTKDLYNQLLKDYDELQQRIEKAVEYMGNTLDIRDTTDIFKILDDIENILRGEDDE